MNRQYTAINICAGMGIMSMAFEQTGFQVICNLVKDQKEKSIISENSSMNAEFFDTVVPENLPYADIVIGKLEQGYVSSVKKAGEELFLFLLCYVKPMAFFFDMSTRIRKNKMLLPMVEQFERESYTCQYQEVNLREATGFPIRQRRGYMKI